MIKVLIVEDSPLIAKLIFTILETDPAISVAGIARDGLEAIEMIKQLKPDLITMDIHLPKLDGVEVTKQVMAYHPTPILILTSSVFRVRGGVNEVFIAMSYGALDVIEKKVFEGDKIEERSKNELIEKVKLLSRIRVISHPLARLEAGRGNRDNATSVAVEKIVGIVASTGGPQALLILLKALPRDFQASIVVVQHIASGFVEGLVDWLDREIPLKVKLASSGETLKGGTVYIAPTGLQMKVTKGRQIALLSKEPAVGGFCPSGTLLLESISEVYGSGGIGVVLTGMGRDGADGLKAIYKAKGRTIAQDEKSSAVFGMPKAAIDLGIVNEILPLDEIADRIVRWVVP